jgi:hypothetical protein
MRTHLEGHQDRRDLPKAVSDLFFREAGHVEAPVVLLLSGFSGLIVHVS